MAFTPGPCPHPFRPVPNPPEAALRGAFLWNRFGVRAFSKFKLSGASRPWSPCGDLDGGGRPQAAGAKRPRSPASALRAFQFGGAFIGRADCESALERPPDYESALGSPASEPDSQSGGFCNACPNFETNLSALHTRVRRMA